MKIFLYSYLSFSLAWIIHFIVWRIAQPKKHTRALLNIFMSVLVSTLFASTIHLLPTLTWVEALHVNIFYVPTMLAYICFYSAIEEDSPTVQLIKLTSIKKKCQIEDYNTVINDQLLVGSRLQAMVRDGLLVNADEYYYLTPKGVRLGHLFSMAYSFFRFESGG